MVYSLMRIESPADTTRLRQPESLDDLLLYRFSRLVSTASSMVIRLCEGRFGISRREWRVLGVLAEEEGLLSSQLAQRAQLDRARTSKAVSSLVGKKLLTRAARPSDRRQVILALTDSGRALHRELFPLVRALNQELLQGLPEADVARLDAVLRTLQARAQQMVASHTGLPKANRRRGGRAPRSVE